MCVCVLAEWDKKGLGQGLEEEGRSRERKWTVDVKVEEVAQIFADLVLIPDPACCLQDGRRSEGVKQVERN